MRLHDYLDRLEARLTPGDQRASLHADVETLRRLHLAHRETFLFENLTIQTGGQISLDLGDLERKFLDEGRGGYCFEQNTLFAEVLREVGLKPVTLLGRVRRGPPEGWARTHMVLRVPVGPSSDDVWLADVGFGAVGLLEPMPLRDGATSNQGGFEYALRREPFVWVLSMRDATSTTDLYEFSEDPQTPRDVEVANHFTATHSGVGVPAHADDSAQRPRRTDRAAAGRDRPLPQRRDEGRTARSHTAARGGTRSVRDCAAARTAPLRTLRGAGVTPGARAWTNRHTPCAVPGSSML